MSVGGNLSFAERVCRLLVLQLLSKSAESRRNSSGEE